MDSFSTISTPGHRTQWVFPRCSRHWTPDKKGQQSLKNGKQDKVTRYNCPNWVPEESFQAQAHKEENPGSSQLKRWGRESGEAKQLEFMQQKLERRERPRERIPEISRGSRQAFRRALTSTRYEETTPTPWLGKKHLKD